jgi:purine-cytosine permease-like protein
VVKYAITGLHILCWLSLIAGSFLVSVKGVDAETTYTGYSVLLSAFLSALISYELARQERARSEEKRPTPADLANLIDLTANRPVR